MLNGSCACGAVHFSTTAQPTSPSVCHCSQCRKMSGHAWASASVPQEGFTITGTVRWISLSDRARRGICPNCGAFLFWQSVGKDRIDFALGAIDGPTGLTLERHLFTTDKGDYYALCDDLPQLP